VRGWKTHLKMVWGSVGRGNTGFNLSLSSLPEFPSDHLLKSSKQNANHGRFSVCIYSSTTTLTHMYTHIHFPIHVHTCTCPHVSRYLHIYSLHIYT
jgi:hypothetical protein